MTITMNLPEHPVADVVDSLTPRETEVLQLVAAGYSNAQICNQLYLSINSVKTYIRSAYRKIGVETRAQAILWSIRYGLIDLDDLMMISPVVADLHPVPAA
ncbi:MAG: response regulator transcription factor [Nocardioides sp.]